MPETYNLELTEDQLYTLLYISIEQSAMWEKIIPMGNILGEDSCRQSWTNLRTKLEDLANM